MTRLDLPAIQRRAESGFTSATLLAVDVRSLVAEVERLRAAMRDALDELDGMSMDSAMKDLREALGADHG